MSEAASPSLRSAAQALDAGDAAGALLHLLAAWRALRCARVADAVDAVSERTRASRPAITGKTLSAQRKAWLEVAEAHDPLDVARLAAVPWPGKWQDAETVASVWMGFPEDPRIAALFARVCCEAEYDSYRTLNFYVPVLNALGRWGDRRVVAPLAKNDGGKRYYYKKSTMRAQERVLEELGKRVEPTLAPDDEAALRAIEAHFAGETREAATLESLWAEVLRRPEDRGAREVWADALVQRGDERGELVGLLLAEPRGLAPKAQRRLGALKKRLRRAHAGDLDELFEDEPRVYDEGLFAGGVLSGAAAFEKLPQRAPGHVLRALDLRHLTFAPGALELAALPTLRTLTGVSAAEAARLATLGPWPLVALGIANLPESDERTALDAGAGFPALRLFGAPADAARWLVHSPLCRRLDTIWAYSLLDLAAWLTALEAQPAYAGRVIARSSLLHEAELVAEAQREADGWSIDVRWGGAAQPKGDDTADALCQLLGALSPRALRRLAVRGVSEAPTDRLARTLARHAGLVELALSFAPELDLAAIQGRPSPARRRFDGGAAGPRLRATVAGSQAAIAERALAAWDTLEPLGIHADSVQQTGHDRRWGELARAPDPRALVAARARELADQAYSLVLVREDATALSCWIPSLGDGAVWVFPLPPEPATLVPWLHDVCARMGAARGEVRWDNGPAVAERAGAEAATRGTLASFVDLVPGLGAWLGLVAPALARQLVPADEAELRAAGAALHAGPAGLVLRLGEDPSHMLHADAVLRVARALRAIGERAFARLWGWELEPLAREIVAPAARAAGIEGELRARRPDEPRMLVASSKYHQSGDAYDPLELRLASEPRFARALSLELHAPLTSPTLTAYAIGWHDHPILRPSKPLGRFPVSDAASARAALETVARALGGPWP